MKIIKTSLIPRVRTTSWPRGEKAIRPTAASALSPVVAVVGIQGNDGKTTATAWVQAEW